MNRRTQLGDSGIIQDYFEAWLDEQADRPTGGQVDSVTDSGTAAADVSLSQVIARTARCAELIANVWPSENASRPQSIDAREPLGSTPPQLGRYALLEELGRGRFGIVYRAHDARLQRDVAIKVARPEVSSREDLAKRFLREAAAAARLDHPGIVPVHDAGESDRHLFYVMPYCQGEDLARWISRQQLPVDQRLAADLVRQLAEATHYGHTQGIVHRDLKPANILLTPQPDASAGSLGGFQARILDFGLSRSLEEELQDTRSSMIVGTPLYMSPEQAGHGRRDVGPHTDVFALGAILYELLTGEPPFAAASLPQVIELLARCEAVPPRKRRPDLDPRLEQICLKCLRFHPEDRYASAQELADDLGRFLQGQTVRARRAMWFDRLRWWAARPQRLVELGTTLFIVNFGLVFGTLLLCLASNFDPDRSMGPMPALELLYTNLPTILGGLFISWLSVKITRGSKVALWLATVAAAIQLTICSAVLFLGMPPLAMYQGNTMAKRIMHVFLLVLFSFSLAMCIVGLYSQRRSGAQRREA